MTIERTAKGLLEAADCATSHRFKTMLTEAAKNLTDQAKEIEFLKTCSVIEIAIRNPSVNSWMREMESQLNKARGDAAAKKILSDHRRNETFNEVIQVLKARAAGARETAGEDTRDADEFFEWEFLAKNLDALVEAIEAKQRGDKPVTVGTHDPETGVTTATMEEIRAARKKSPVALVAKMQIVPGTYGRLSIVKATLGRGELGISLMSTKGLDIGHTALTAAEVREMRDVLDAILPVLEAE